MDGSGHGRRAVIMDRKAGTEEMETLRGRAWEVLAANDRGRFTVPTAPLYPYQWMWDSAWIALGWAESDEGRAWTEIESLFSAQWPSGMLPHIIFHEKEKTYFPGPDVWQSGTQPPSSGITQPPVVGTVVRWLYENAVDRDLAEHVARDLWPRLLAYHRWLYEARDPEGTGLVAILHPWESGMDNSPVWDEALARVPVRPDALPERTGRGGGPVRRDVQHVDAAERPTDDDYRRYMSLVAQFRDAGYDSKRLHGESPFCVVDAGFNALLHRANLDLLALAEQLNLDATELEAWTRRTARAFETLWSQTFGMYLSWDRRAERSILVASASGLLPLFAGIPTAERAARMAAAIEEWGRSVCRLVPSTAPSDPRFDPRRYWRGPVWVVVNWLLWHGLCRYGFDDLARRVREDTMELLAREGFREYYDPRDGRGLGGHGFSWSAALLLHWTGRGRTVGDGAAGGPPGEGGAGGDRARASRA